MRDQKVVERAVMRQLLADRGPWALADLEQEIGSQVETEDAVVNLVAGGLVHRREDCVFASRAAVVAASLFGDDD